MERKRRRRARNTIVRNIPYIPKLPSSPEASTQELEDLFSILDANGDGFVDTDEFQVIRRALASPKPPPPHAIQTAAAQFILADTNRDGKLSLEEWMAFSKSHPARQDMVRHLIQRVPEIQVGYCPRQLEKMPRKQLFGQSKKHGLCLDSCTSNQELRAALGKLLEEKRPKQSWGTWILSFW